MKRPAHGPPPLPRGFIGYDARPVRTIHDRQALFDLPCTRLRHEALAIKIGGLNIAELTDLPVSDMIPFFDSLKLTEKQQLIGKQIFKEIKARLNFLQTVGLDYLTLSRTAGTLSGGEASESAWRPRSAAH